MTTPAALVAPQNISVDIHFRGDPIFSYVTYQAHLPLMRQIELKNNGDEVISDIEVEIRTDPEFAVPLRMKLGRLDPHLTHRIEPVTIKPQHAILTELNEAMHATLIVNVIVNGHVVAHKDYQVEVLAYDQWPGTRAPIEILAAFSLPNHPEIDRLLFEAGEVLSSKVRGQTMNGYQSKSKKRIKAQVAAIYAAVGAAGLRYGEPPASFGSGQKVRTPDRIFSGGIATCLDMTMLLCSCLEQAGLNPVVLINSGHAWIGCWLIGTHSAITVMEDCQIVRDSVDNGELVVFESTALTQEVMPPFQIACEFGRHNLAKEQNFICAIDIGKARLEKILPLPSRPLTVIEAGEQEAENTAQELENMVIENNDAAHQESADLTPLPNSQETVFPDEALPIELHDEPANMEPEAMPLDAEQLALTIDSRVPLADAEGLNSQVTNRIAQWQSMMLDLTKRNSYINFKPSDTALCLHIPNPAMLERMLSDGHEWSLKATPVTKNSPTKTREGQKAEVLRRQTEKDSASPTHGTQNKRELSTDIDVKKLNGQLHKLFTASRLALEESGANTLYLTIGCLHWTDDVNPDKTMLAPILLVPVALSRQSVCAGYTIKRHDDDVLINPTLIQLLREKHKIKLHGIEELSASENGIDVEQIWQAFRSVAQQFTTWNVTEQVYLENFSFTKYHMWKDLNDRAGQLKNNRVLKHLIEHPCDVMSFDEGMTMAPYLERSIDHWHNVESVMTPLLADASQLRAISRASAGQDLVIIGPPGTGKSQTGVNLAANFVSQGKSVCFVSEKMAALEVFERGLHAIGLAPFCQQLHSSKAKKATVLAQLRAALDASSDVNMHDWTGQANKLVALRSELNSLVQLLHRPHRNGLTIRNAIDTAIQYKALPTATMPWTDPDLHGRAELDALREIGSAMQAVALELSAIAHHPLAAIDVADYSHAWETQFYSACDQLDVAASQLQVSVQALEVQLALPINVTSVRAFDALAGFADLMLSAHQLPQELLHTAMQTNTTELADKLQALCVHGTSHQKQSHKLLDAGFTNSVASLNGSKIKQQWIQALHALWPIRWLAQREIAQILAQHTSTQRVLSIAAIPYAINALITLNEDNQFFKEHGDEATNLLGLHYQEMETDWLAISEYEQWIRAFCNATSNLKNALDLPVDTTILTKLQQPDFADNEVNLDHTFPHANAVLAEELITFQEAWKNFQQHRNEALRIAGMQQMLACNRNDSLSNLRTTIQRCRSARSSMRVWCRWRQLRGQAIEAGLDTVVENIEQGQVDISTLAAYVDITYQVWWLKAVIDREPVLRSFSSADHERKIQEFRLVDTRYQELTARYIVAQHCAKVQVAKSDSTYSKEMGTLSRELAKQRGHLSVRQLIHAIPTLMTLLKPILMMSPLSMAQYLSADHNGFDVIIFDEASQVPVWDAVGAISRGKQLIVLGDPKQLPPTPFFNGMRDDVSGIGTVENISNTATGSFSSIFSGPVPTKDLDSILDECIAIGMPSEQLQCHYRSRYESLIAFSNIHYYDNKLITFPSPVIHEKSITLKIVPGVYDRGTTKTNRVEADAIIRTILAHFADDESQHYSLGVVTFNQAQQELITQLLEETLRKSPELEQKIDQHGTEKLFIKNLENVQGDERDFILFSITYGKDTSGKMMMSFGPLNQAGGQKRLNVAITRARRGMTIFSSIGSEDIDVTRTQAAGVKDLKHYLEYAQNAAYDSVDHLVPFDDKNHGFFEKQIADALRRKGWEVHANIGRSGHKLDLGVVHPFKPSTYLLGIECDGISYHASPTARDRNKLRQQVLEELGWKLHRMWSVDWWDDAQREMEKLEAILFSLLEPDAVCQLDTKVG